MACPEQTWMVETCLCQCFTRAGRKRRCLWCGRTLKLSKVVITIYLTCLMMPKGILYCMYCQITHTSLECPGVWRLCHVYCLIDDHNSSKEHCYQQLANKNRNIKCSQLQFQDIKVQSIDKTTWEEDTSDQTMWRIIIRHHVEFNGSHLL